MKRKQGSVFVLALVVMVAATAVLALTVEGQRQNFKSTVNRMEAERARAMAESAVQRAVTELATVTEPGLVEQTADWYSLGTKGSEKFSVGSDSFRFEIVDASSLLSLNTATEAELQNLNLTTAQIDSLLDWREPGDTPRTEGAKDEYYNNLPKPYGCRKARLETLDEVLLIKDWLPTTLMNVPTGSTISNGNLQKSVSQLCTVDAFCPNTDASGQAKTDINTVQLPQLVAAGLTQPVAQAIIARRNGVGRFQSMNQVFGTPGLNNQAAGILLDRFTATTQTRLEGRLNLNTASVDVLALNPAITTDIAQAIVSRQSSGFATLSEILQVPGVTVQLLAQIADQITVGSDTFIVRAMGTAGRTTVCLEVVVKIGTAAPTIVRTIDPYQTDMSELWEWTTESESETVLVEVGP